MVLTTIEGRKVILRFASEIEESKFHLARNFDRAFGLYFSVMKRRVLVTALLALLLPASGFAQGPQDRKSTRLNSSHLGISYAVFCLKKKKHGSELKSYHSLIIATS